MGVGIVSTSMYWSVFQRLIVHSVFCSLRQFTMCVSLTCSSQWHWLVHQRLCHHVCDTACKRSLVICHKSRASCPISYLMSVPIKPACAEQRFNMIQTNKQTNKQINKQTNKHELHSCVHQSGIACACGHNLPSQGKAYTCDMGCSGNANEMCGGDVAISIYQTNSSKLHYW